MKGEATGVPTVRDAGPFWCEDNPFWAGACHQGDKAPSSSWLSCSTIFDYISASLTPPATLAVFCATGSIGPDLQVGPSDMGGAMQLYDEPNGTLIAPMTNIKALCPFSCATRLGRRQLDVTSNDTTAAGTPALPDPLDLIMGLYNTPDKGDGKDEGTDDGKDDGKDGNDVPGPGGGGGLSLNIGLAQSGSSSDPAASGSDGELGLGLPAQSSRTAHSTWWLGGVRKDGMSGLGSHLQIVEDDNAPFGKPWLCLEDTFVPTPEGKMQTMSQPVVSMSFEAGAMCLPACLFLFSLHVSELMLILWLCRACCCSLVRLALSALR